MVQARAQQQAHICLLLIHCHASLTHFIQKPGAHVQELNIRNQSRKLYQSMVLKKDWSVRFQPFSREPSRALAFLGFRVPLFQTENIVIYFEGLSEATSIKKAAKTKPLAKKQGSNESMEQDRCPSDPNLEQGGRKQKCPGFLSDYSSPPSPPCILFICENSLCSHWNSIWRENTRKQEVKLQPQSLVR